MKKVYIIALLIAGAKVHGAAYLAQAVLAKKADLIAQLIVGASIMGGPVYQKAMKVAGVTEAIDTVKKQIGVGAGAGGALPKLDPTVQEILTNAQGKDAATQKAANINAYVTLVTKSQAGKGALGAIGKEGQADAIANSLTKLLS